MMDVSALPAFQDNYIWLLTSGRDAAVVDPGDAAPVDAALAARGLTLRAILLTHHHADHVGGAPALAARTGARVYAPVDTRLPSAWTRVGDGDRVAIPELDVAFDVLEVPGHTSTHIAFHGDGLLFCGDTLFSAGCGRLFEGTPEQMTASLARLAALPPDTRVYCGHEYTVANCRFGLDVLPYDAALERHLERARRALAVGAPSLPSTIGDERAANVFLRCDEASVRARVAERTGAPPASNVATFAALRAWKDTWRAPTEVV